MADGETPWLTWGGVSSRGLGNWATIRSAHTTPRKLCFHVVCLFVCWQDYATITRPIFMKFGGKAAHWPRQKPLDFGGNPDLCPNPGILKPNFGHAILRRVGCLVISIYTHYCKQLCLLQAASYVIQTVHIISGLSGGLRTLRVLLFYICKSYSRQWANIR